VATGLWYGGKVAFRGWQRWRQRQRAAAVDAEEGPLRARVAELETATGLRQRVPSSGVGPGGQVGPLSPGLTNTPGGTQAVGGVAEEMMGVTSRP
jgi:hypothetical protein